MRVFDHYNYNIANKVNKKDTVSYLEKMLADLGTCNKKISFNIDMVMRKDITALTEAYPALKNYLFYYEPYRSNILTSLTPDWDKGQIYADDEAKVAVLDIFTKIPRGYNISGRLMLHGIDWYNEGINEPLLKNNFDNGRVSVTGDYCISDNAVIIERNLDDGNKFNQIQLIVEATSEGEPHNTQELVERLEPYLGKPESSRRECCYDPAQSKVFKEYRDEVCGLLEIELASKLSGDNADYQKRLGGKFIPSLVDAKIIKKAFAGTDFELSRREKGTLPGANNLTCFDKHNYRYDVTIDRAPNCTSFFNIYVAISGCNFSVSTTGDVIVADSREEAEQKLTEFAGFTTELKEKFGDILTSRFGDTPAWFWESSV